MKVSKSEDIKNFIENHKNNLFILRRGSEIFWFKLVKNINYAF